MGPMRTHIHTWVHGKESVQNRPEAKALLVYGFIKPLPWCMRAQATNIISSQSAYLQFTSLQEVS